MVAVFHKNNIFPSVVDLVHHFFCLRVDEYAVTNTDKLVNTLMKITGTAINTRLNETSERGH